MRALADLIMRGRAQACGVAVFGSLLPLISPAAIGLVTLRKDSSEGLIVALWALLPWLALYLTGGMSPLLTLAPSAALVVIVVAANVLRTTASWQWTLIGVGLCSAVAVSIVGFVASADIDQVVAEVAELDHDGRQTVLSVPAVGLGAMTGPAIAGFLFTENTAQPVIIATAAAMSAAALFAGLAARAALEHHLAEEACVRLLLVRATAASVLLISGLGRVEAA